MRPFFFFLLSNVRFFRSRRVSAYPIVFFFFHLPSPLPLCFRPDGPPVFFFIAKKKKGKRKSAGRFAVSSTCDLSTTRGDDRGHLFFWRAGKDLSRVGKKKDKTRPRKGKKKGEDEEDYIRDRPTKERDLPSTRDHPPIASPFWTPLPTRRLDTDAVIAMGVHIMGASSARPLRATGGVGKRDGQALDGTETSSAPFVVTCCVIATWMIAAVLAYLYLLLSDPH